VVKKLSSLLFWLRLRKNKLLELRSNALPGANALQNNSKIIPLFSYPCKSVKSVAKKNEGVTKRRGDYAKCEIAKIIIIKPLPLCSLW
jgi:hypothetical protein